MKSSYKPKISIGLPVYNGDAFLAKALDSIVQQDYDNIEIIISDNASTDSTPEICLNYARIDDRISYSRLPENIGAHRNFNRAFSLSSGDFFKWASHDDVIRPQFLSRCLEVFDAENAKRGDVSIVCPGFVIIDENDMIISDDPDPLLHAESPWPALRVYRTLRTIGQATEAYGLMPREMVAKTRLMGSFISADYVFVVEAAMLGRIIRFDDILFSLRRHNTEASHTAALRKSTKDVISWIDPAAEIKLSENNKLLFEYMKSAINLKELTIITRVTCIISVILSIFVRRSRIFVGRERRRLAAWIRKKLLVSERGL